MSPLAVLAQPRGQKPCSCVCLFWAHRILLTHTAGFGYAGSDPDLVRWAKYVGRKQQDVAGTVEAWNLPLKFTPGQGWYYGASVDWAGQVVEKVTGQTLGDYMAAHVLAPLGMHDTTWRGHPLAHLGEDRIVPTAYRNADTGELAASGPDLSPSVDPLPHSGGAGLCTTAADYAKLLRSLLQALAGGGDGAVVGQATAREMFTPQLTPVQGKWFRFIMDLFRAGMASEFAEGMPLDHGISGVINLQDSAGKRRKGSMMWAGVCGSHWVSLMIYTCMFRGPHADRDAVCRPNLGNWGLPLHKHLSSARCCGHQDLG